jgi:hypothetical protein
VLAQVRNRGEARSRLDEVHIVENDHEVRVPAEQVGQNRQHFPDVRTGARHAPDDRWVDRCNPIERADDLEQQQRRIVVRRIQRNPRNWGLCRRDVLDEERRLPEAGRPRNHYHRCARLGDPPDQGSSLDELRTQSRGNELRLEDGRRSLLRRRSSHPARV